ncbi:hypothetical protein [Virgibacillus ndiopensis]|uniref:hypothetical protein n=1 Tax=Virgibacillus ndiopensis TaxID=2004408 RepID=UPI000C077002|nr:hypothetical protein [Virgibacillus ndiopensis]
MKDIATQENTTIDTVKSWEQQVRNKLKEADLPKRISWDRGTSLLSPSNWKSDSHGGALGWLTLT